MPPRHGSQPPLAVHPGVGHSSWAADILRDVSEAVVERRIVLDDVHNFRDLGGYPTADGRRTKWRTLFRADGLQRLQSAADIERVAGLGLRSVIDLRTESERRRHGVFPTGSVPVRMHHLSIIDLTWGEAGVADRDDVVDFLVWGYRDILANGAERLGRAIEVLAEADTLPAVFHCAVGKDRTGLLAALVLGLLGVDDEVIAADYALTVDAMRRLEEWARDRQPDLAARLAATPRGYLAADPRAMRIIVQELRDRHGSIADYVREVGVSAAALDALRNLLLH